MTECKGKRERERDGGTDRETERLEGVKFSGQFNLLYNFLPDFVPLRNCLC